MNAALGISQLKKVSKLIEMRRSNAAYMTQALSGIKDIVIPEFPKEVFHVYQEFAIRIKTGEETRDALRIHLAHRGIMSRVSFHPVHLTHFYRNVLGYDNRDLKITEELSSQALTLPLYPSLSKPEMDYVALEIRNCLQGKQNE